MSEIASVWTEAGASAEAEQAARALAVAKQAAAGTQQFLFLASSQGEFEDRLALAADSLLKAAALGGVPVETLVAEQRKDFGLLLEAKQATVGPKEAVERPMTCPTCAGARAVPAQGHEPFHEVSNGQVRCPDCAGHGQVQPTHPLYPGVDNPNELTSHERYGDTKWDDFYGMDPGDAQDRWYNEASKRVASVRTALAEGVDPLTWLEQQAAGEGQAEKPSEAGIEAVPHEGSKAAMPPFLTARGTTTART
jgi:hypothetical protein